MDDYTISTPEQLHLSYTTAGLASRFMAFAVDTLIQMLVILILFYSVPPLSSWMYEHMEWYIALWIVLITLVFQGYFLIFELLMKGRTPGKALLKIRVVRLDGRAADPAGLVIRNLLRIVDALPASYTIGVICIFVNQDNRRLGDLAAGTIVVVDQKRANLDAIMSSRAAAYDSRLSDHEAAVVRDFLARSGRLSEKARASLASQIASPLYDRYDTPASQRNDPEAFLRSLHDGR